MYGTKIKKTEMVYRYYLMPLPADTVTAILFLATLYRLAIRKNTFRYI